jgi:hypothetical protein
MTPGQRWAEVAANATPGDQSGDARPSKGSPLAHDPALSDAGPVHHPVRPRTSGDPPNPWAGLQGAGLGPADPPGSPGTYGLPGTQPPQPPQPQGPSGGQLAAGVAGAGLQVLGGYLAGESQQNVAQTQAGAAMAVAQIQAQAQQEVAQANAAAAIAQAQAQAQQAQATLAQSQINAQLAQQGYMPPGYQPAPPINPQPPAADPNAPQPMSTGAMVGIGLGVAAALAGLVFLANQKPAGVPSAHYAVDRGY